MSLNKIIVFITIMLLSVSTYAQTVAGFSGLYSIPTAELNNDGDLIFGTSYLDKKFYSRGYYKYNGLTYYTSLTFLPFFEISLRLNQMIDYPYETQGIGDRMPAARFRILSEKKYLPAISLGLHDFVWVLGGTQAIHFNSTYLAVSKNLKFDFMFLKNIGLHLAYGSNELVRAEHYQFIGFFGGISISPTNYLTFYVENDGKELQRKKGGGNFERNSGNDFHLGGRVVILKYLILNAGLFQFKTPSGSLSLKIPLLDK